MRMATVALVLNLSMLGCAESRVTRDPWDDQSAPAFSTDEELEDGGGPVSIVARDDEDSDADGTVEQDAALPGEGSHDAGVDEPVREAIDAGSTLSCDVDHADCDGDGERCEADLSDDPRNCGSCGEVCPSLPGGARCMEGACVRRIELTLVDTYVSAVAQETEYGKEPALLVDKWPEECESLIGPASVEPIVGRKVLSARLELVITNEGDDGTLHVLERRVR